MRKEKLVLILSLLLLLNTISQAIEYIEISTSEGKKMLVEKSLSNNISFKLGYGINIVKEDGSKEILLMNGEKIINVTSQYTKAYKLVSIDNVKSDKSKYIIVNLEDAAGNKFFAKYFLDDKDGLQLNTNYDEVVSSKENSNLKTSSSTSSSGYNGYKKISSYLSNDGKTETIKIEAYKNSGGSKYISIIVNKYNERWIINIDYKIYYYLLNSIGSGGSIEALGKNHYNVNSNEALNLAIKDYLGQ